MPKRDPGPSVKDNKVYEALRDEGNSKEKSARIANAACGVMANAVVGAVPLSTSRLRDAA